MLRDCSAFFRSLAALYRSALFQSFFFGSPESRAIARNGVLILGAIALANACASFGLQHLVRIVGDMCQKGTTIESALWVGVPAAAVYFCLSKLEPYSEQKRTFLAIEWARAATGLFQDKWITRYRGALGPIPDGISQIITDRPLLIAKILLNLFPSVCRAVFIIMLFVVPTWRASAELSPTLAQYVPGWLLILVLGYSFFEWRLAARRGKPLGQIFDISSRLLTDFRTEIDNLKEELRDDKLKLCERIKKREEARVRLQAWYAKYMTAYVPNERVLYWKSYNQQSWQFLLVIALPLAAATGHFSVGAAAAAVYAINELRGAVLTLSNNWLIIMEMEGQDRGLREIQALLMPQKPVAVPTGVLQPAE